MQRSARVGLWLHWRPHHHQQQQVVARGASQLLRSAFGRRSGWGLGDHRVLRRMQSTTTGGVPPSKPDEEHEKEQARLKNIEKLKLVKKELEAVLEASRHQVVNVPNVITFARILSTPYLAYLIVDGSYTSAIGVLAVAGFSDWLDGYIARTYKQESIIGSFLDPFADKLMIGTLSLSMLYAGLLPWPLMALIFGRDTLLISGTLYHRFKTKDVTTAFFDTKDSGAFQVEPSMLSKANTLLQFSLFGLTLTNAAWQLPGDSLIDLCCGVVGTTTFLSGSEYLYSYVNQTGAFKPLHKKPPTQE